MSGWPSYAQGYAVETQGSIRVTVGSTGGTLITGSLIDTSGDPGNLTTRLYAVNCGGPEVSGWVPDTPYANSVAAAFAHDASLAIDRSGVSDPAPEAVYRSERYAPSGSNAVILTFPVQATVHKVRVHLAENWPPAMVVGGRVHTVEVGVSDNDPGEVDSSVDVFSRVGAGNRAYVLEFIHTMTTPRPDLQVVIGRVSGDHPRVQGVEVLAASPLSTTASIRATGSVTARPTLVNFPSLSFPGGDAFIDGNITNPGSEAEGLLMNVRLVQATSDFSTWLANWDAQANTDAFVAMLPTWAATGVNAITVNAQGGNFGPSPTLTGNSFDQGMWNSDGSVRTAHRDRLLQAIEGMLAVEIVPIVGLFYFRTDQVLTNEAAVLNAVDNAKTIFAPYKNSIIIEVANEVQNGNWDHAILQADRVHEIVDDLVAEDFYATASHHSGDVPTVAQQGDGQVVLLHANGLTEAGITSMVNTAKARFPGKPIIINEDGDVSRTAAQSVSRMQASVAAGASWGYHEPAGYQYWSGSSAQETMDWSISSAVQVATFDALDDITTPAPSSGGWGEFPTILNSGWADWNLDEIDFGAFANPGYTPPPPLPDRPQVPSGVNVNPSTIQSEVNNRPAGTTFILAAGTYNMTLPTKAGNRYFGNRDNWGAVVFSGQNSRQLAIGRGVNGVEVYYMTFQNYLGYNEAGSWNASGAIDPGGSNWRLCGIVLRWNHYAGLYASGSGRAEFIRAYQNGQYAFTGPGANWTFDCIEVYENGEQQYLPAPIQQYSTSDRGASKFGQNYNLAGTSGGPVVCRRWHSYRNAYHGIWFDIRIEDIVVEYCWFQDQPRAGIDFEAGRPDGRPIIARFNRLDHCGYQTVSGTWWSNRFAYYPAAIQAQICDNTEIYCNVVVNGPRGIGGLHDESHPQYDGSASTPGAGTVNASPCRNLYVHHNYLALTDGGSNPNTIAAGVTRFGASFNPYAASANNRWRYNQYANPTQYGYEWELNRELTWAEWQARGHT